MIEKKIAQLLTKKKLTLAIAESCTGGLVSHRITNIPGSSKYFVGGIIAYAYSVKTSILGVPQATIKKRGAVSRETVLAMAKGARRVFGADVAVSITGIAGPAGGTKMKPVGLAYIAFDDGKKVLTKKVNFKGTRKQLKEKFARAALQFILLNLK